ncbi:MAG: hypothetical protein LBT13_04420 [Treponema sp.]|nr:hypothetical protein [Treponema sp.]
MKISAGLTRSDVVSVLEAEQLPRFTAGTYRVYLQYSTGSELKEPR